MTPELVERGDRLIVSAPFTHRWKLCAAANGGRWDAGSMGWTFHVEEREAVKNALAEIFEEDEP